MLLPPPHLLNTEKSFSECFSGALKDYSQKLDGMRRSALHCRRLVLENSRTTSWTEDNFACFYHKLKDCQTLTSDIIDIFETVETLAMLSNEPLPESYFIDLEEERTDFEHFRALVENRIDEISAEALSPGEAHPLIDCSNAPKCEVPHSVISSVLKAVDAEKSYSSKIAELLDSAANDLRENQYRLDRFFRLSAP